MMMDEAAAAKTLQRRRAEVGSSSVGPEGEKGSEGEQARGKGTYWSQTVGARATTNGEGKGRGVSSSSREHVRGDTTESDSQGNASSLSLPTPPSEVFILTAIGRESESALKPAVPAGKEGRHGVSSTGSRLAGLVSFLAPARVNKDAYLILFPSIPDE